MRRQRLMKYVVHYADKRRTGWAMKKKVMKTTSMLKAKQSLYGKMIRDDKRVIFGVERVVKK